MGPRYLFGPDSLDGRGATVGDLFDAYRKRNLADMSAVNIYFEVKNEFNLFPYS